MTTTRFKPNHMTGSQSSHGLWFKKKKQRDRVYHPTIGEDIELKVAQDHKVKTHPTENRKRRTLLISKTETQPWGFTLQSYGIQRKDKNDEVDTLTYVDYVEYGSPAYLAGMQAGDVIISINGESVEALNHKSLINFIRTCPDTVRIVVLFEDCCRKVDHHLKLRKLKKLLAAKMFELKSLENIERDILEGRKDTLSLHSESIGSLADDSYSLMPEYADVFPVSHGYSYSSLPRNFNLKDARDKRLSTQSADINSNCSTLSLSGDDDSKSIEVTREHSSFTDLAEISSPICLNPRVDSRYTSLPPDVRRRNGKKSDRHVGNSMFYGEWLSESGNTSLGSSLSSISTLSRDSGIYQTWSVGMMKNKLRNSTRSVGNSLFYLDSESETLEEEDEGEEQRPCDMDTSSSTLEASQSSLNMVLCNDLKHGKFPQSFNDKYKKRSHNSSAISSADKHNISRGAKVCSHNTSMSPCKMHNNEVHSDMHNNNTVMATRSDNLVKGKCSPIRPLSLPNLQQCFDDISVNSLTRDSEFESPVFINENVDNSIGDNSETISDWMASETCDHMKRTISVDNILTSSPNGECDHILTSTPNGENDKKALAQNSKLNIPKTRKNTLSAGDANTGKLESKRFKLAWRGKSVNSGSDLSQSMGNLTSPPVELDKSATSPNASFKAFRLPSFKLSRSKIRNSLSRLRNRSSSYFFPIGGDTTTTEGVEQNSNSGISYNRYSRNKSSNEIASPNDIGASLVRINADITGNDYTGDKIRRTCSNVEAFATLPRRGSRDSQPTVGQNGSPEKTSCNTDDDKVSHSSLVKNKDSWDNMDVAKDKELVNKKEITNIVQSVQEKSRCEISEIKNKSIDTKPKRRKKRTAPKPPSDMLTTDSLMDNNKIILNSRGESFKVEGSFTGTGNCQIIDKKKEIQKKKISDEEPKVRNTEILITNHEIVWSFVPALKSPQNGNITDKLHEIENVPVSTGKSVNLKVGSVDTTPDYSTPGLLGEVMDALNSSGSSFSSQIYNQIESDTGEDPGNATNETSNVVTSNTCESSVSLDKSSDFNSDDIPVKDISNFVDKRMLNHSKQCHNENNDCTQMHKTMSATNDFAFKHSTDTYLPDKKHTISKGKLNGDRDTQCIKSQFNDSQNEVIKPLSYSSTNSLIGHVYNSEFWNNKDHQKRDNFVFGSTDNIISDVNENADEHLLVRPGWKSPLSQRHANKLTMCSEKEDNTDNTNGEVPHDYENVLGLHGFGTSSSKDSLKNAIANKVKFFSRNMNAVNAEEDQKEGEIEKKLTVQSPKQPSLTSVNSKPGSPFKRIVIHTKKLDKFSVPDSELLNRFKKLGVQNNKDQLMHIPSMEGIRSRCVASGAYKRKFYTYEEIPSVGSELKVVNSQESETWL